MTGPPVAEAESLGEGSSIPIVGVGALVVGATAACFFTGAGVGLSEGDGMLAGEELAGVADWVIGLPKMSFGVVETLMMMLGLSDGLGLTSSAADPTLTTGRELFTPISIPPAVPRPTQLSSVSIGMTFLELIASSLDGDDFSVYHTTVDECKVSSSTVIWRLTKIFPSPDKGRILGRIPNSSRPAG
jgi:hypothetical protein